MMRIVSSLFLISSTKGARVFSNLEESRSGGGTKMVTFGLTGKFRIVFHFTTSGNWSFKTRSVFLVAVAVINIIFPPRLLSSPVERAMAGRKAGAEALVRPQLTTKIKKVNLVQLRHGCIALYCIVILML